jgi:hypothetical protein
MVPIFNGAVHPSQWSELPPSAVNNTRDSYSRILQTHRLPMVCISSKTPEKRLQIDLQVASTRLANGIRMPMSGRRILFMLTAAHRPSKTTSQLCQTVIAYASQQESKCAALPDFLTT